jgi:hypothetical protein
MSNLQSAIENAANAFARTVIAAVKGSTIQELLALRGGAAAKPGRKPGRPPKATAKKTTKKAVKTAANRKRSINYPKCSVPGCGKNRYAKGNGMCGEHFKASKAG